MSQEPDNISITIQLDRETISKIVAALAKDTNNPIKVIVNIVPEQLPGTEEKAQVWI